MDTAILLAIAGAVGALLALLGKWFNVSKARHEAEKAKAEAARAITETGTAKAEAAKAQLELEKVQRELAALKEVERIEELGGVLREYAEQRRRETHNSNIIFSDDELAHALGNDANLLKRIMQRLQDTGHAKRSFAGDDRWEIDFRHFNPGAFGTWKAY